MSAVRHPGQPFRSFIQLFLIFLNDAFQELCLDIVAPHPICEINGEDLAAPGNGRHDFCILVGVGKSMQGAEQIGIVSKKERGLYVLEESKHLLMVMRLVPQALKISLALQ